MSWHETTPVGVRLAACALAALATAGYIGHFGLDCGAEPFLWRYYIDGRGEFERYIEDFRQKFPFVKSVPVQFRLVSTRTFGNPFALQDPTVRGR